MGERYGASQRLDGELQEGDRKASHSPDHGAVDPNILQVWPDQALKVVGGLFPIPSADAVCHDRHHPFRVILHHSPHHLGGRMVEFPTDHRVGPQIAGGIRDDLPNLTGRPVHLGIAQALTQGGNQLGPGSLGRFKYGRMIQEGRLHLSHSFIGTPIRFEAHT